MQFDWCAQFLVDEFFVWLLVPTILAQSLYMSVYENECTSMCGDYHYIRTSTMMSKNMLSSFFLFNYLKMPSACVIIVNRQKKNIHGYSIEICTILNDVPLCRNCTYSYMRCTVSHAIRMHFASQQTVVTNGYVCIYEHKHEHIYYIYI